MSGAARDFAAVRRLMDESVGAVFPAAQLAVVDGGVTVLDEAVGACRPDTIFDVASLTKALATTTLAMRLVARGTLSLDDEVRPGVPIRLLLCHAGGLPPWRPFYMTCAGQPDERRAIVEAARAEPLESEPGTKSAYSDLGFILLGDAIERAGGARLDEQWAALGVSGATYHPDPARCAPTEGELRGVVHDDNCRAMGGVAGHAGLFATAADVSLVAAKLVGAWHGTGAGDESLVEHEVIRRFWSPAGIANSTWCLGWDRPAPKGSSAGTRWPATGVGHLGFTGCSLWIDPPGRRWVVLLSNRVYPTRANEAIKALRPRLHDAIVAALDGP